MGFQRLVKVGSWVSDVGLGTWKLGYPELGDGSRVQPGQALRIMDRAAELGCVFWDTADRYNFGTGNAERIRGQWFARNPLERTNIVRATKGRVRTNGETPRFTRVAQERWDRQGYEEATPPSSQALENPPSTAGSDPLFVLFGRAFGSSQDRPS